MMTIQDRPHVHIAHPPPEAALKILRAQVHPSVTVSLGGPPIPSETTVLVTGRPTTDMISACTNLRALVVPFAGIPDVTRTLMLHDYPNLPVYNLHHNAVAAAELAVALLMAAAKTLIPVDRKFRKGDWRSRYDGAPTTLLEGKRLLLLGLGAIGARVAAMCHSMGMNVVAIRRNPNQDAPAYVRVLPPAELRALLPVSDVLMVCLPLTPETEGLIGEDELRLLPASAILVNVARGPIVDEEALFKALQAGRLVAGLDVWYRYPKTEEERASMLPSSFPFHELENVVMSPHRGGAFRLEELEARRMCDLARTVNAIVLGDPVPHRVDLEAGY